MPRRALERRNGNILLNKYSISRVGFEPTISRVYIHTLCPYATTGLNIYFILKIYTIKNIYIIRLNTCSYIFLYYFLNPFARCKWNFNITSNFRLDWSKLKLGRLSYLLSAGTLASGGDGGGNRLHYSSFQYRAVDVYCKLVSVHTLH